VQQAGNFLKIGKIKHSIFCDKITIEQCYNLLLEFRKKCVILLFLEFWLQASYVINLLVHFSIKH